MTDDKPDFEKLRRDILDAQPVPRNHDLISNVCKDQINWMTDSFKRLMDAVVKAHD